MTEDDERRAQIVGPFLQKHFDHRKQIRSQSASSNKNLLTAHQLALAAVVSYQNRIQGIKYDAGDAQITGRMALVAQFIQGVGITETAISEGLYAQAANLLKQELETLASIEEFEAKARKDGRTPKFRGRLTGFGRRYGEFNEIAHPTRQEVVEQLSSFTDGDRYGPTTVPQFNTELFQMLYGNQAMLIAMLFGQMQPLFVEAFGVDWDDTEVRLASTAIRILIDEGIIKEIPAKN
ncbi:hypothetical protein [Roseibium alexandrii]|uniref:Uncharacterized protein n=1 Tax=Roseibium alexandrii TaxID=388408 RepID=A0A0M6ZXJ8_9HYPH|nr:hypothetical protein [Roseibium alexandrii]CTQ67439.1 hypothetical protein LAX5112_01392 [Roseibium alexandrii]